MNLKKGVVLGIALVLAIFWTSSALASSISITSFPNNISIGIPIGVPEEHTEASGGSLFFEANAPGSFSKTGDGGGGYASIIWTSHVTYAFAGADSFPCTAGGSARFTFVLTQEGPLRFTSASWSATLLVSSSEGSFETPLEHVDADADLLKNGGTKTYDDSFDLGITKMPVTWTYEPTLNGWFGEGRAGAAFGIRLDLTGTVAPVPLPPTLLLLGSGLGGLAIVGRRKVCGRT